ncbi:hypothetical protein [Methanofollis sp. W23]|uniref:hypothetical protein n=1 Tax=Methanofollis sp. W23 TaxID=2817849 RepID=UPI001AEABDFC|nr:hypothetical protein [Methanofollis sp. W23]
MDWLDENYPRDFFDEAIALRALRHLQYHERWGLFSEDYGFQRTCEGRWYEFLVYEIVRTLALQTDTIQSIVRKGVDVRSPFIEPHPGQNGLYYSDKGDLTVRGNGQTIAEMDLMYTDPHGDLGFFEVITSTMDLQPFHDEVCYKKTLLASMLGQERVPFVLVSSVDVSRYKSIQMIASDPDNLILITNPVEEIRNLIYEGSLRRRPERSAPHPKAIDLAEIGSRASFDYLAVHDRNRERVVRAMLAPGNGGIETISSVVNPISKKIMLGTLDHSGAGALFEEHEVRVKDAVFSADDVVREFGRVVIAFDIPGYTPVIYLKVKGKKEYLKVVLDTGGDLVYQGKRTPAPYMSGFYEWLDEEKPLVAPEVAERYASIFLDAN